jgi:4-hydroxy-2-oxoheptanedioate aldolase
VTTPKAKLARGEVVLAVGLPWPYPGLAEALGYLGFDCVVGDGEHSSLTAETFEEVVRGADVAGKAAILKTPLDVRAIGRCLDAGAAGVQVAHIESAEEATQAVRAARYCPVGIRGIGITRARRYRLGNADVDAFADRADSDALVIVQVESAGALSQLPAILEVEGVDVVLVGSGDLRLAVRGLGPAREQGVKRAIEDAVATILQSQKVCGVPCRSVEDVTARVQQGVRFVLMSASDILRVGSELFLAGAGREKERPSGPAS